MADAVMSALGDVFDDMTLQILHRKKEKAGAPEKLVASVGLVAQCTSKLEQIALALAKDEYADFPVVAAEINDAAKSVRDGAADMAKAVAALQKGGDTVSAWDDVGSAVGLMVQKTVLLLEIVYGAEVKVLNLVSADAVRALEVLGNTANAASKDMSDDDVDKLIAEATKVASTMKPVAERLMQRAKSEPAGSPTKAPLESRAKAVLDKTNQVIQAANALAQKPEDPILKAKLLKAIEDLHHEVSPLCSDLAKLIPRVKKAAEDVVKNPRKLNMGKGKPGEPDGPVKNYKIVQPTQFDLEEEAERPWPKLRHVDPNDRPSFPPHVPDWANPNLRSGNPGFEGHSNSSVGAPQSPRSHSPPPSSGSVSPGRYQRDPKDAGGSTSPRRGWKPGHGSDPAETGPARGIRVGPPKQLPFNPEDPPMAWPVLRHVDPDGPKTFSSFALPYFQLRSLMPPAATLDAMSHINHALDKGDIPAIEVQLKNIDEIAPGLGLSAFKAIKDELKDFSKVAKADPAAARSKLTRALQQTSAPSNRGPIKFKPIEQLPPASETPFKWPTLRHWVGESLVTLHDEVEAAFADWEELEKSGKDTTPVKSYILSAMDCLHDVIAPKLGLDSAAVVKNVAVSVNKLAQEKKPNFASMREAIRPLVPEANLPPAWLTKLRARNAAKRLQTGAQADLVEILNQVRAAISSDEVSEKDRKRVFDLIDRMLDFSNSNNNDSLLKAADELCALLKDLLLRNLIPSDLLNRLFSVVAKQGPQQPPASFSPRRRGFENVAARAEQLGLKLPPAVKGSKLLTDDSPLVVQTRKIGQVLAAYAKAATSNNGEELVASAKELGALCKSLSSSLSKLAPSNNRDVVNRLNNITRSLNTLPTQIRILSNVKAASNDKHGHNQLLQMVEALSESLVDVVPTVNSHILSE